MKTKYLLIYIAIILSTFTFVVRLSAQSTIVTGVTPSSVLVGQTPMLTISGNNFTNSPSLPMAVLNPGGYTLTVSYISSTQLSAPLPTGIPVGNYTLDVTDAVNGTAPSLVNAITIEPQVDISGVSPGTITFGQTNTLTVTGQNFTSGTQVSLNGFSGSTPTIFQSETQLQVTVPATIPIGTYSVTVSDPSRGNDTLANGLIVQSPPQISVTGIAPVTIVGNQSNVITVSGANFTSASTASLVGFGSIPATYLDPTRIQMAIPSNVASGQYIVQITDPIRGSANSPQLLTVLMPTERPTALPAPTATIQATDVPGSPNLLVQSYSASPTKLQPGGTATFTVSVTNQGSRAALGVSVSVDTGQKYIPANGQSSILLPDLGVGSTTTFSLTVVSAQDTPGGMQTFAISFNYRDFSGTSLSSKSSLSIEMESVSVASQITLSRYQFDPQLPEPGKPVTVTLLLTNSGNETAGQVLVSVAAEGILLAGPQGSSLPVGDLKPGESKSVDLPLIVSTGAKAGPQAQSISISYLQKGENKSVNASMTITVAKVNTPAPIMLLESYDTGKSHLIPGEEFTLDLTVKNIGNDTADNVTVTFGNVESSSNSGTDATPSGFTSTPSTTFAPLGSGGTQFIGKLEAEGGSITIEQDFIVNASVDSGVYSLPITLRYARSDGTATQDNLRASLVVIVQPTIRITQSSPLPTAANVGDSVFFTLEIANRGRKSVNFSNAVVTADNATVLEGGEVFLGPIRNDDQGELTASISPIESGQVTITIALNYTDDLNRPAVITQTYTLEALDPPPIPDPGIVVPDVNLPIPEQQETISSRDFLGKLLLGLLGLGS